MVGEKMAEEMHGEGGGVSELVDHLGRELIKSAVWDPPTDFI